MIKCVLAKNVTCVTCQLCRLGVNQGVKAVWPYVVTYDNSALFCLAYKKECGQNLQQREKELRDREREKKKLSASDLAKYKAAESRRVERIRNGRVKALGVSELNRYKEDAARRQRECRQRRKAASKENNAPDMSNLSTPDPHIYRSKQTV